MPNRLCDTEIWTKDWFLELSTKQKLLVKFLFDNCDCAGFYKISWHLLNLYFNDEPLTIDDFKKIKQVKFIDDDFIFIEDFALYQYKVSSYNELNPKNNAHLGVLKLLKKYNIFSPSLGASQPLTSPSLAPSEPLVSPCPAPQDKEKDKEKEKVINSKQGRVVNIDDSTLYLNEKEKEKLKKEKESSDLKNWHGEYSNVYLSPIQYAKLVQYVGKKEVADELIEDLSSNIASKRENAPPYDEEFPDMHLAKLKAYWKHRRLYRAPQTIQEKQNEFKAQIEAVAQKFRIEEEKERANSG